MRPATRAAAAAGVVLAGLLNLPVPIAGATGQRPVAQRDRTAVTTAADAVPTVAAYPPGVSHTVFLHALEHTHATGDMQLQGVHLQNGALVASGAASSGYALPAGAPPVACTNVGAWPIEMNAGGVPCYLASYEGRYVDTYAAQDIYPGQSAQLGATYSSGPQQGQVAPAAWQLAWNNLFDYQPLMRDTYGNPGNDITGYDTEFLIIPGLDNSSCYSATTGPFGGGYNAGRYQNTCTIGFYGGPYYGTPAGQQVPWTLMTGAVIEGTGGGIPAVYNCGGTCNAEWVGQEIESPVMLEPSPYAGFSDVVGTNKRTVTFTDQTLSDLQITSWAWDFGDGQTSSAQSPVHTYAKGGQYTVSLKVTTVNGQTSTASTTVTPPGTLSLSATLTSPAIQVGSTTGAFDVTVTNPDKDPISGIGVSAPTGPTDGSFTVAAGTCITNCVDPLPAGASSVFQLGLTGVAANDATAADAVTIGASATVDSVAVRGSTTSPVVPVNDALTVTGVAPTGGQIYGGDSVTVTGTGFQTPLGTDTVTGVNFVASGGGTSLPATDVAVSGPTQLTLDSPDASSVVAPAGTGGFDVVVSTAYGTSPTSASDQYTYGCQTQTSTPVGGWQFSGCFNSPQPDQYTSTTAATLDGLTVNPAGGSSTVAIDTGAGTLTVPAGGNVAVTVGGAASTVCAGALTWDLTAASVSCPAPGGRLLGLAATGPVTLTPQAGGAVKGSVPVRLPGILGAPTGTLSFVVSDGSGLSSASVVTPGPVAVGDLVSATVSSMTLDLSTGTWTTTGTARTSAGATANLKVTTQYGTGGSLTAGTVTLGKVDIAGVVTLSGLGLTYNSSMSAWTGSPGVSGASAAGTMSLTVNDATGAVTAGSIGVGAVSLFDALPLGSLTLTHGPSSWVLASTPADTFDGTVSATFPVASGAVTGATVTQDGSPINLYAQLPSNSAVLAYSASSGKPVYTGPLTVDLPGATDGATPATLTATDDGAAKIKIAATTKAALFGGVTLTSLSAPVTGPTKTAGTSACGSVGADLGPQVGTGTAQIASLKGLLSFAYPTSGSVLYQLGGKLTVPTWKTGGGALGVAALGLLQGQATASVTLALGTGTTSSKCPLAKLPAPSALTLAKGVTVNGTLTGSEGDDVFFLQGTATFAYPPNPLLPAAAKGTVVVNEVGLTACATVKGHTGLYGFAMTWGGAFTSYATGNCVLPTTSTGFGCQSQTSTPAGAWLFSGCFSSPNPGQYASTLDATLDGLGLNPAGGSSTVLIDTGAETATVPSGGSVTVVQGALTSTLCNGPLTWSLTAASVSCTPSAGTRLFGLPMTGAVTLSPQTGGVVHGTVPVSLPGILGAAPGSLSFVVSAAGGLQSAKVTVPAATTIGQVVSATISSMTLNVTNGQWTAAGTVHPASGATATLSAVTAYDSTGNLSTGTVKIGRVDLAGTVTWASLVLGYSTSTKKWTASPAVVGVTGAGSVSLTVSDPTGTVSAGSIALGPLKLFGALPLGSLTLTYGSSAWKLASTPATAGAGTLSASFPVGSAGVTGATITQDASPIALYGQQPVSGGVFGFSVAAGSPVYSGTLTVALPGATTTSTAGTLTSTNDGPAVVKVSSTSNTALFAGVDLDVARGLGEGTDADGRDHRVRHVDDEPRSRGGDLPDRHALWRTEFRVPDVGRGAIPDDREAGRPGPDDGRRSPRHRVARPRAGPSDRDREPGSRRVQGNRGLPARKAPGRREIDARQGHHRQRDSGRERGGVDFLPQGHRHLLLPRGRRASAVGGRVDHGQCERHGRLRQGHRSARQLRFLNDLGRRVHVVLHRQLHPANVLDGAEAPPTGGSKGGSASGSMVTVPSTALREGDRVGPFELPLDPELVRHFAEATLDTSRQFRDGRLVPPSLVATQVYRAQFAAITELVPDDVFSAARSGVHGQHDLLLHRPIMSDENLHTFVETHCARPSRDNLHVTLHHSILDGRVELVAEQWWTTVLLGTTAASVGPGSPTIRSPRGTSPLRWQRMRCRSTTSWRAVTPKFPGTTATIISASKVPGAVDLKPRFFTACARWPFALALRPRPWRAVIRAESAGWRSGSLPRPSWATT